MIEILEGDMLTVLPTMEADSLDSCCTDPPYHLTSIVRRFANASLQDDTQTSQRSRDRIDGYARAASGFMGKRWDGGDIAFRVETWREVYRVLKPGAHIVAFGGTRTFHRMMCAIEDAGFEYRDTLCWLYGSGFPKSHDVSKAIDKRPGVASHPEFAADLRVAIKEKGFTNTFDVAELVLGRRTGAVANWQKYQFPEAKWWPALRDLLGMDGDKWDAIISEAERLRTGQVSGTKLAVAPGQDNDRSAIDLDLTDPATDAARIWSGWGTALKPAWEPIILARKPLSEKTVAANVLRWGTGAINVDGCRIGVEGGHAGAGAIVFSDGLNGPRGNPVEGLGRWPANVCHDGSAEVLAGLPATNSTPPGNIRPSPSTNEVYGDYQERSLLGHTDAGSAARFFYSAKADATDRLQSRHPTVKPVDLIRWLVRMVTPPGGTVLDCFAGSGTTGMAAMAEGFNAVLVEHEAEYVADIRRRVAHVEGADTPLFAETRP